MFDKINQFVQQLYNNLSIFCLGIVVTIIGIAIVKIVIAIRHNKIKKIQDKTIGFEDVIVPFIIIFLVFAATILVKSWNGKDITDGQVLTAIVSFVSPFIAFIGAYTLAEVNYSRSEKQREKKEESSFKEKKEINNKKLEHKRNMLYTMLEFSLLQTRIATKKIEKLYRENYKKIHVSDISMASKYNLTGNFTTDYLKMIMVKNTDDFQGFINYTKELDNTFISMLNEQKISDKVIYIKNWYDYLDCVQSVKDVQSITHWINLVNHAYITETSYAYMFLTNRHRIDDIIKREYPMVIDEGLRGQMKKYDI